MAENSVFLKALTPEAKAALGSDFLEIRTYPFRVGRESRIHDNLAGGGSSRRRPDSVPNNDLYLTEPGNLLNVSREHLLIDRRDGMYVLADRCSACGTLVEGELVGEHRKGGCRRLQNHDVIIVGTSESPFVFKFVVTPV